MIELELADMLEILASGGNGSELVDINSLLEQAAKELRRRPKWNGGFAEARKIATRLLVPDGGDLDYSLLERVAEALVEAFDDGVAAEHCAALGRLTGGTKLST
jgi:hypothetical protein